MVVLIVGNQPCATAVSAVRAMVDVFEDGDDPCLIELLALAMVETTVAHKINRLPDSGLSSSSSNSTRPLVTFALDLRMPLYPEISHPVRNESGSIGRVALGGG